MSSPLQLFCARGTRRDMNMRANTLLRQLLHDGDDASAHVFSCGALLDVASSWPPSKSILGERSRFKNSQGTLIASPARPPLTTFLESWRPLDEWLAADPRASGLSLVPVLGECRGPGPARGYRGAAPQPLSEERFRSKNPQGHPIQPMPPNYHERCAAGLRLSDQNPCP